MFAALAVVAFVIGALAAFGTITNIDALGMVCVGLACLGVHLLYPVVPWGRRG